MTEATDNHPSPIDPFKGLPVCAKAEDGTVLYQSIESQHVCGDRQGSACDECGSQTQSDVLSTDHVYHNQHVFSRLRVQNNGIYTTVLVPDIPQRINFESLLADKNLSPRELEIANYIKQNLTNSEMVDRLVISESTLKTHLNNLYRKVPELKVFRSQLR